MRRSFAVFLASAAWVLAGCSDDTCDPADPSACDDGFVCESVQGLEESRCFAPVQVQGRVFNLDNNAAVANAVVSAVDENGAPVGDQAVSNTDGSYALTVRSVRSDEKGTPVGKRVTLRAAARDYLPFPAGIRVSLPVDTTAAARTDPEDEELPFVVKTGVTDVGLLPLPAEQRGGSAISGKVEVDSSLRGVLVVAEQDNVPAAPGYSAVADSSGEFSIFNVPAGAYTLKAYARGANFTPATASVQSGKDLTGVELKRSGVTPATVSGSISLVNPEGGTATSVVLVVESTFNPSLVRGEVPAGMRSPEPGIAPNITGAFSISGVPDGRYVVLAAFENDLLVRDPNESNGGTSIQRIIVTNGQADVQPTFKVTGAIGIVSPGAGDVPEDASSPLTFTWKKDSSSKAYDLVLFNSYGVRVWETTVAASSNATNSKAYDGAALPPGIYQWRVTSKDGANPPNLLSQSEDLKGIFRIP